MNLFTEEPRGNVLVEAGTGSVIPLAMQNLELAGRATPAGAMLRVTHQFKTEGTKPMEAIYTFMLPRNGTLRRFIVKGEDFEVESKLEPRKEAREEYEKGVEDGHLSVLAEANPDGMVSLAVGQVQPDEMITVILDIVSGVEIKDNTYRFRFPFTLAPSYHAKATVSSGGKIELPSDVFGDLILPEWKSGSDGLHQVSFRMNVEAAGKMESVSSPSHRVLVRPNGDGSADVELSGNGDIPNRDLVIDVQAKEVEASVFADAKLVSKKSGKDDPKIPKDAPRWTAFIPSSLVPKDKAGPRKVCFVLDDSGSMGGSPITQAKLAVQACLSALRPTDEFGMLYFGSNFTKFDDNMAKATDANRKRADKFISHIDANSGGTNLAPALGAAISILGGSGGDIFLMTDGQVFDTGTIIEQCASAGTRVHVLGIGSASQDRFLSSLARRTDGVERMVGVDEDVTATTLELFNSVRQPVRTDVKAFVVTGSKMAQEHKVSTIWDGYPVLLVDDGTTGLNTPTTITLTWGKGKKSGKIKIPVTYTQKVPNGLSGLLYAGRKVEDLEISLDAAADAGPAKVSLETDLKEVSTTYGLASRAMSLIAVVKRAGDQAGQSVQQKVVAVGIPEGMNGGSIFRGMPQMAAIRSQNLSYSVSSHNSGVCGFMPTGSSSAVYGASMPSQPFRGIRSRSVVSCSSVNWMDQESERSENEGLAADDVEYGMLESFGNSDKSGSVWSLFTFLVSLQSDGGLPGGTRKERARSTVVLALAAYMADKDSDTPMYTLHIERMLEFLDHYLDLNTGKDPEMAKLVDIIKVGQVSVGGDWMQVFNDPFAVLDSVWDELTTGQF